MHNPTSRRQFIKQNFYTLIAFLSIAFTSCRSGERSSEEEQPTVSPESCDDLSGLSMEEIQKRESFAYVTESPVSDSYCNNCHLWIPQEGNKDCGKCLLFMGPVYASGYCTYWAPQE